MPKASTRSKLGGLPGSAGPAWGAFLRAHAALVGTMSEELEAAHTMPLTTYDVLRQLALAPAGRLRMAELADRVMLSRPGLTGVVNRLEEAGLVRREASDTDGRGLYAAITDAGLERLHTAHATHVASIRRHFSDRYTEAELRTLHELLGRLANQLDVPPSAGATRP
jgi:DNA-binding MarR family transcriptional regulator